MDRPERGHRAIDKVPFGAIGFADVGDSVSPPDACHVQTPRHRSNGIDRLCSRERFPFAADLLGERVVSWVMVELELMPIKDASRCLHSKLVGACRWRSRSPIYLHSV